MHRRTTITVLAAVGVVPGTSVAQTYTVTPAYYATNQGNETEARPFTDPAARWQQIHGDLRGTPRTLSALAFRKGSITLSNASPRRVELVIICADSKLSTLSGTFASNYVGTPVVVLARSPVTLPSWAYSQGTPEPWTAVVPFTTPFMYSAQNDLLWELQLFSNTAPNTAFPSDAYDPNRADRKDAQRTEICCACRMSGVGNALVQSVGAYTMLSTKQFYFSVGLQYGQPHTPAGIMVGITNPSLQIPGLCTKLFTTAEWVLPWWTDGTGSFWMPPVGTAYDPAWDGYKLYVQTVLPDAQQPGLPVALSQAHEVVLLGFNAGNGLPIKSVYATDPNAATGGFPSWMHIVRLTH